MSIGKFLLRLGVGVCLAAWMISEHEVQLSEIVARIATLPLAFLLGAIALDLLGQTFSAYRWARVSALAGHTAPFPRVWSVYFSGMFFNMCLPTSIGGDVVRVVGLGRHTGSKSAAFASVFMDRNIGLAALLSIGLCSSLAVITTIQATFYGRLYQFPLWPLFVLLILGYIAANAVLFSERPFRLLIRLLTALRLDFVARKTERLHAALQSYRLPWTAFIPAFLISAAYQFSEIALVWIMADGIGIRVSPWVFGSLVPFQAVACLLPITFSGIGVREGVFCAILMGQLGPSVKDEALALSLIYFVGVVLVSGLIGGVVYMVSGMPRPAAAEMPEAVMDPVGSGPGA